MRLVLSKSRAIDFRVSTLPTMYGEKIVLRILDPSSATLGIDALGYEPEQKALLLDAISRPYGMVLVTGPTGSGKTVSLYTCLNILNKPGINISTAEDPAEIPLPGINQVNIDDRQGLTFPVALKAFLRQDPDIIMVGEIRDAETAQIAVQASLTGHLVLSTLHTNSACGAITRLRDMGVEPFLLSSSLSGVIAQRLVRRLCPACRAHAPIPDSQKSPLHALDPTAQTIWQACGCSECRGTGYQGRLAIHEIMLVDKTMRSIIHRDADEHALEQCLRQQSRSLRENGLLRVLAGETTLEEVMRVTSAQEDTR